MHRTNQEWCTTIVDEIISTEESYVASLQEFHDLGQFCRSTLSTDEFNYFFTPLINILRIQKPYLFALRQHRENLVYEVPRIMTEHFDNYFMQLYSAYVDRYRQSLTNQTTLQMQITNKKFDTKVKQFGVPVWMPVDSYLALPVGRVPRYKLLLSDLARRLPEDRRDEVNGCISTIERFLADLHNRAMQ